MTESRDPRPGQRFTAEPAAKEQPEGHDPRPAEPFDADLPTQALPDSPDAAEDAALAASLTPPRRRRWGLLALLGGALGLGSVEAGLALQRRPDQPDADA